MEITKISFNEKLLLISSLQYLLDEGYLTYLEKAIGEDVVKLGKELINYITNVPSESVFKEIKQ